MAGEGHRNHLRIESFAVVKPYRRPSRRVGQRDFGRETEQHAEKLKREFASAWAKTDDLIAARDGEFSGDQGRYIEFEALPNAPMPNLSWSSKGIRLATASRTSEGVPTGALFVPDKAAEFVLEKLNEYQSKRSPKSGKPSHKERFDVVEHLRAARLESLWVDARPIPTSGELSWWEVWCWPDRVNNLKAKVQAANVLLGEGELCFPERTVLFLYADRERITRIVASCDAVAELRLGRDDAHVFVGDQFRADEHGWVESAVERIEYGKNKNDVAVCLLDTGVNRAHPLLSGAFAEEDLYTVHPRWGVDDHHGHGSEMSGLALYGDLVTRLPSMDAIRLEYSAESVKILPPHGFPETEPASYGLITQQAIARPEIGNPERARVYSLAITQPGVWGPKATSWSAALDLAAFGGDDLSNSRQRLICVSAGNLPEGLKHEDLEQWDDHEVEDPAHAWNILTAGAYTQKGPITDQGYEHWSCAVEIGSLSPYSRVSATWNRSVSPIKPDLVLEGGNKGRDSVDDTLVSGMDSLSLLTTSNDPIEKPLTLSWATSAATAQLAGMAAAILADDPALWPETVRALLVSSARWTPSMEVQLLSTAQKSERLKMLRRFGYGIPDLERALRSKSNVLALVAENLLTPYSRVKGEGQARLNQAHFYQLPWPKEALLALGEREVRLRIVLSYFVEPNPSADAPLSPARYRSTGLRFDLRRRGETQPQFEQRINALASVDVNDDDAYLDFDAAEPDQHRLLGEKSIAAGSLHVDEWRCSAADLADRHALSVFPVGGWWKASKDRNRNNQQVRYALVVTIDAGDVEFDLWLETAIAAGVVVPAAEGQVEIEIN